MRRKLHLYSWTGALLLVGILLAFNFVVSFLPVRLDSSDGRVYSISKGTKEILKKLDDIMIVRIVYSSQLPPNFKLNEQYVRDLLAEYRRTSRGKIRLEFFDPSTSPQARQQAIADGVAPVQLEIRERDRREVKECFMGLSLLYGDKRESIQLIQDTDSLEYEITARIKKLLDPTKTVVGLATNAEALSLSSEAMDFLRQPITQLYDLREIDLAEPIPADMKSLWVLGPQKEIDGKALANLKTWIKGGGTAGFLVDSNGMDIKSFRASPLTSGLESFFDEWGVGFKKGLVVDPQCDRIQIQAVQGAFRMINIVDYPYFPWVNDLDRQHPAVKNIDGFTLPFVSAIEVKEEKPGITVKSIARSSRVSYIDPSPMFLNPLDNRQMPQGAEQGPFSLAVVIEGTPGRVILFGTSRFIRSDYPPRESNLSLFVNMIDWSIQDEALLSIRSKTVARRPVKDMSDAARLLIKYLMIFALPLLALGAGLFVWRRGKTRRALLPLKYADA